MTPLGDWVIGLVWWDDVVYQGRQDGREKMVSRFGAKSILLDEGAWGGGDRGSPQVQMINCVGCLLHRSTKAVVI